MSVGLVIFFGIVWSIVCSIVAGNKQRSVGGWATAGFFFGIFALLVLAFMPRRAPAPLAHPDHTMLGIGAYPAPQR